MSVEAKNLDKVMSGGMVGELLSVEHEDGQPPLECTLCQCELMHDQHAYLHFERDLIICDDCYEIEGNQNEFEKVLVF